MCAGYKRLPVKGPKFSADTPAPERPARSGVLAARIQSDAITDVLPGSMGRRRGADDLRIPLSRLTIR